MVRYFSIGVANLVALMAAHRIAMSRTGMASDTLQGEFARISAELQFADWPETETLEELASTAPRQLLV